MEGLIMIYATITVVAGAMALWLLPFQGVWGLLAKFSK